MTYRFVELASILEPERTPKIDKAAILVDAVRMVTQLRNDAQKLKDSNSDLQEKIKELKVIQVPCLFSSFTYLVFEKFAIRTHLLINQLECDSSKTGLITEIVNRINKLKIV